MGRRALIADKLHPPEAGHPAPEIALDGVVVVSACAGAGKTTAVAAAVGQDCAWLTVEGTDADPHVLLEYLAAALGGKAPDVAPVEAAGLLAQQSRAPVVVFDQLERLGVSVEAWAMVEAVARHVPAGTSVVLCHRGEFPAQLCEAPVTSYVDLAGQWPVADTLDGDALAAYIDAHVFAGLADDIRAFLVSASLLEEISPAGAEALGLEPGYLAVLRHVQLPGRWDGAALRLHPVLRSHLMAELERRGRDRELRLAHARWLAAEGRDEDATETFLRFGDLDAARETAERSIEDVGERLDFTVAERWLEALGPVSPRTPSAFDSAELMIAIGRYDVRRAVRVADRLAAHGERENLARASERAAWAMLLGYLHTARFDDVAAILDALEPGPVHRAVRYAMSVLSDTQESRPRAPDLTGGPLDGIVYVAQWGRGNLLELSELAPARWVEAVEAPWHIAAVRALGRTERALELFEEAAAQDPGNPALLTYAGPDILMDAGRPDDALRVIGEGRRLADATGTLSLQAYARIMEAKFHLRTRRDTAAARAALDQPECRQGAAGFTFMGEVVPMWEALAQLLDGQDAAALLRLRAVVAAMEAGDRVLELPTAAVYLSEAESRMGDDDAADRSADLALDAAARQGSNHLLLQALADFPAVCSRRIEAESGADSAWHELGRALIAQGVSVPTRVRATIQLREFGRRVLLVDGEEVRPRIAKSYELLAYLAASEQGPSDRETLLGVLFGDRRDNSTRSYLRQAIQWLRKVLPCPTLITGGDGIALGEGAAVISESVRLEAQLAEAARLQGVDRLNATLDALAIYDQGPYLPGAHGAWADERDLRLIDLAADARYQAAVLSFGEGRYDECRALTAQTVASDPFRESAWRLAMRAAHALGDDGGVLKSYRACEAALATLDMTPAPSTRQLLERLRR